MDPARQILRYGIPGALFLLWATAAFVIAGLFRGADLATALAPLSNNVSLVVAVAGTVPVGWACYQVYNAIYGPLILGGRLVRRDRGFEVLQHLQTSQLALVQQLFPKDLVRDAEAPYDLTSRFGWQRRPDHQLPADSATPYRLSKRFGWRQLKVLTVPRDQRRGYAHMWRIHWEIVCALVDHVAANGNPELKSAYTQLSDIYHGVGAARVAMWLGSLAGLAGAAIHSIVQGYTAGPLVFASATMLLVDLTWGFGVLHRVRRRTWVTSCSCLGRGLYLHFATHPDLLRDAVAELEIERGEPSATIPDVRQSDDGPRVLDLEDNPR